MNNIILLVQNLFCGYDKNVILEDINFSIKQNKILSILGTNGSGKTTLVKTISNAIKPLSGSIFLQDKNLNTINLKKRSRKIAVVTQFFHTTSMSVKEYVLLGRLPFFKQFQFFETKKDHDIVDKYLKLTNTFELKDTPLNQISGGEKQLVSIARALVQEPVLLLLDEPTAHLDIFHQTKILSLIDKMKTQLNIAVLIVLHDINLASEYSDDIVLLDKKKKSIYSSGSPENVITMKSIKDIYNTDVRITNNPVSKKPSVFLLKHKQRRKHDSDI